MGGVDLDKDVVLYEKFLLGSTDAFEELISLHKESLILFIYSYIKNMSEAEDIMIDVFAKLIVSKSKFHGKSTLKTYLFSIARNEALHYIKKNRKYISFEDIGVDSFFSEDSLDSKLLKEEDNLRLYLAMETLNNTYREVLFLLYFEDMSYKEAGKVMRKSEKQITNLAYRAKKSLKEKLQKEGFIYDGE